MPPPNLRTPKGTVDFHPAHSKLIERILTTCKHRFNLHGARSIDTPVLELFTTLRDKYGEESKLIYELADGTSALRYDLTVSFARYLAQHRVLKMRRYQIGKVFRRDQPAVTKGRFREFYQCDFDICGRYAPLLADAETIKIATEILQDFELGTFTVKVNHRKLLEALFMKVGIEEIETFCSAIDKLDKIGIEGVKKEMMEKGATREQSEEIEEMIKLRDLEEIRRRFVTTVGNSSAVSNDVSNPSAMSNDVSNPIAVSNDVNNPSAVSDTQAKSNTPTESNTPNTSSNTPAKSNTPNTSSNTSAKSNTPAHSTTTTTTTTSTITPTPTVNAANAATLANVAIDDLLALFTYLQAFNCTTPLQFDFSLARGLDYYTGIVFEAQYDSHKEVGSVMGGGRYDNLVKRFCKNDVPCVGFSVGVLRIFSIMREQTAAVCDTKVYVISGMECVVERMRITNELWESGIETEMNLGRRNDIKEQREYARKNGIGVFVIVGGSDTGTVKVLFEGKNEEVVVPRNEVVGYLTVILRK